MSFSNQEAFSQNPYGSEYVKPKTKRIERGGNFVQRNYSENCYISIAFETLSIRYRIHENCNIQEAKFKMRRENGAIIYMEIEGNYYKEISKDKYWDNFKKIIKLYS